jgi:excinuclease ABC subunit A
MEFADIDSYSPKQFIVIKNARVHNLKNLSVAIPRKKLVVITGLSGSGKSSLAFDTIYAEGQRRYVESLSSYARQFLGRMPKPEVDYIKGISPAIAIEQKVKTFNPRSTVGTSTEIYDFLKVLFARVGKTYSPFSGLEVKKDNVTDVVDYVLTKPAGTQVLIECPVVLMSNRSVEEQLLILQKQGYSRISVNGDICRIEEYKPVKNKKSSQPKINIVIDRILLNEESDTNHDRISDSVQTAFYEGQGSCIIVSDEQGKTTEHTFSDKFEADGMTFEEPSVNLFTFNNPYGACKRCEGFGNIIGIDEDLVIPNKHLSIYEEAVACWKGEKMSEWKDQLVKTAYKFDFPIHKPYMELSEEQKQLLWNGNDYFEGINAFFKYVEEQTYKIQYRVMLARYRGKTVCPECRGTRLRKDASYVKIAGKSIVDVVLMPLDKLEEFFSNTALGDFDQQVSKRILPEINHRIQFLIDVGLPYLTLNRASNTLSGGESQRINLATALGSSLVGSMYILDEPSIGLHPRDTDRLIEVLKRLRNIGNTVIVVEHDEDIIRNSDYIVDIGPLAGSHGGELIFSGDYNELLQNQTSLTSKYLNKLTSIPLPKVRNAWKLFIGVEGAHEHNLKNVNVKFPLKVFTVVTGVSGSGKTTLVKKTLFSALKKICGGHSEKTGKLNKLTGDIERITNVEYVDQNPIGKSSRSNPATYIKAYDEIRALYCDQQLAKVRGFKPGYFSFNIPGGRCEECQGDGFVTIEMQFMADIYLKCESCEGKRFKDEVLDITWKDKNITDVLDMTVNEALAFFCETDKKNSLANRIYEKIMPLADVGLGYLKLGQPCSTLSGGEAQRLKLATFLSKGSLEKPTLFIFDEPTTGLHMHDIHKLYESFTALIANGHTIIVIEHNMELIKCADWIIDMGPEGGDAGGYVVFEGTPEDLVKCEESFTGRFLKGKL